MLEFLVWGITEQSVDPNLRGWDFQPACCWRGGVCLPQQLPTGLTATSVSLTMAANPHQSLAAAYGRAVRHADCDLVISKKPSTPLNGNKERKRETEWRLRLACPCQHRDLLQHLLRLVERLCWNLVCFGTRRGYSFDVLVSENN